MAEKQATTQKLKIFISYSRHDIASTDEIVEKSEAASFQVLMDRRVLPYGEEWQKELGDFIRQSDTVLWLVSPDSIKSDWCNWELGLANQLKKRLLPIKIRPTDLAELPKAIGNIHVLPAEGVFSQTEHFDTLVEVLNTDRAWLKDGTRLSDRARLWRAKERDTGQLLRGTALRDAELWEQRKPPSAPAPATEVLELILASRQAATRRQTFWVGGSLAVAASAILLASIAYLSQLEAQRQESLALSNLERAETGEALAEANAKQAKENEQRAVKQRKLAEEAEKRALASAKESSLRERSSRALVEVQTDPERGLATAIDALRENLESKTKLLPQVYASAWKTLDASRLIKVIRTPTVENFDDVSAIRPSPDDQKLLIATKTFVHLIDYEGRPLAEPIVNDLHEEILSYHTNTNDAAWQPSGKHFVLAMGWTAIRRTVSRIRLYNATGRFVRELLKDSDAVFTSVKFVDENKILAALDDGRIQIITIDGTIVSTTKVETKGPIIGVDRLIEINKGVWIHAAAEGSKPDTEVELNSAEASNKKEEEAFERGLIKMKLVPTSLPPAARCQTKAPGKKYSGALIAVCGSDGIITLWEPEFGNNEKPLKRKQVIRGHTGPVNAIAFHPTGRILASTGDDGEIRLWSPRRP